jgi:hypothetical protein
MNALRENPSSTLTLPLYSAPPWSTYAVLGVIAASVATFSAIFSRTQFSWTIGIIPGITFGVFGGSALAAHLRRRGASVTLKATPRLLQIHDPDKVHDILDMEAPFATLLLVDPATKQRALVVSQRGDPMVVLDRVSSATVPDPRWQGRVLQLPLEGLALSPASPSVVALVEGQSLDGLLSHIGESLVAGAPLLTQPTQGGPALVVMSHEVQFGGRTIPLDATVKAVHYAVSANGMTFAGIGIVRADEGSLLLFACEDAIVERNAVTGNLTPDAYIPLATYEVLRAIIENLGAKTVS